MDEHFFFWNNQILSSQQPILLANNRAFHYGEGLFETMRMKKGHLILSEYHFERLFLGMKLLEMKIPKHFNANYFSRLINQLVEKNQLEGNARIRLTVFISSGNLFGNAEGPVDFILEAQAIEKEIKWIEKGIEIDIYTEARKCADKYSSLKTLNYLPSVMAAKYAVKNNIDESILLNDKERICESAVSNIFIVNGNTILTPPISEGCIAGTLRRYLLEHLHTINIECIESIISMGDLLSADEIFLTNSVSILRPVSRLREGRYESKKSKEVFDFLIHSLF